MKRNFTLILFLLLFSNPEFSPAADSPIDDDPADKRPSLVARRTTEAITVDGFLDEASWGTAPVATNFQQYEPEEGQPSTQRSEVRILYSNNEVYIGAYLYDDDASKIMQTLGRRDDINQADWFIVFIDSYYDRKTAYTFGLNAAGVQIDGIKTDGGSIRSSPLFFDTSWDAVWASSVRVNEDGWSIEMQIPYSMLRFPEAENQTWGINFRRYIPRNSETSEWSLIRREDYASGSVANFGTLEGLKNIKPRKNIQVTPYTVSGLTMEEGDPGGTIHTRDFDAGVDLKLGISSNITLDATINPDFGQVESDPAVLNLTVFETILRERRPFFVEGFQIFDYRFGFRDGLIYTRRIGSQAPIIGATKLSGRTDNGFSFGFLGAVTGHNFDPTRVYSVGRIIQQIGDYSKIGAVFTAFDNSDPDATRRRSYTGGMDWDLRLKNNRYNVQGHFSFTHRMIPGAVDDNPETGIAAALDFDKTRGVWTYGAAVEALGDTFNPRDMGLLRSNDEFRFTTYLNNLINAGKPIGPFRKGSVRMFNWNSWSYDRTLYGGTGFFLFSSWLTNGFRDLKLQMSTRDIFGGYDQFETRGLFSRAQPRTLDVEVGFSTDTRRSWMIQPEIEAQWAHDEGTEYGIGLEAMWNVGSRLSLETELTYGIEQNRLSWASNESFRKTGNDWSIGAENRTSPDDLAPDGYVSFDDLGLLDDIVAKTDPFAGTDLFYVPVFGERDNRSLDLSLRGSFTFTKDLSLQIFSQLFIAKGKYNNFAILQNPDEIANFTAYPKQHDFSLNSFLVNTVLRWEYRPGSTLFVVWSQSRTNDVFLDPFNPNNINLYDRRSRDQINDVFGIFPTNAFLIKLNYLFRS